MIDKQLWAVDLDTAAEGQYVIYRVGPWERPNKFAKITHATKTKLKVENCDFNRSGYQKGVNGYCRNSLSLITNENYPIVEDEMKRRSAFSKLNSKIIEYQSTEVLEKMAALIVLKVEKNENTTN